MKHFVFDSLRRIIPLFSTEDLNRTFQALVFGDAVRGHYSTTEGKGCLLHFLSAGQVGSRSELRVYFDPDFTSYIAACVVIAAWDEDTLSDDDVAWELLDAIEERNELNAAEQRSIDAVKRRLVRRS